MLLMYDVSSKASFKHATQQIYPELSRATSVEHQFVMLIGNKMDVAESEREVDFEEAQDFAQREAILFSEVSALKRKRFESVLRTIRSKCVMLLQQFPDLLNLLGQTATTLQDDQTDAPNENVEGS